MTQTHLSSHFPGEHRFPLCLLRNTPLSPLIGKLLSLQALDLRVVFLTQPNPSLPQAVAYLGLSTVSMGVLRTHEPWSFIF